MLLVPPIHAQGPDQIETDPIRCWWKTDRGAVRVGERFTLALTCGVIETPTIKVVPTLTQIDPGALQIPPFEVVSGRRADDIVSPPRRYFQYEYVVRLIAEGYFGADANIPALPITYNIQSNDGQGAQGRDRSYVLPAMPIRVVSLVPKDASDIRDATPETFSAIDARRFRATAAYTAAVVFFAFAVLLVGVALVRAFGRVRRRRPAAARLLPGHTILGGAVRMLKDVKRDVVRGGWTPVLARRALAALRVAGAVALDRQVAQDTARTGAEREGQLVIRTGWFRRKRVLVSAPTTPASIARDLSARNGFAGRRPLEQLQASLTTFNNAAYGRSADLDRAVLDTALDSGMDAVRRVRLGQFWPPPGLRKEQWASS
jgi:hypothetical protein